MKPAFTRREFLQTSVALSTISTMPSFLHMSASAIAAPGESLGNAPGRPDDRILVVVQLSGGNDGLNTVVPFGEKIYYDARPRIAIRESDLLVLDKQAGIGLNSALAPIKDMYDNGMATVIQGVGYPNANRSHFASMDVWHTGDTRGGRGVGWIGGALDTWQTTRKRTVDATACVCIGREAPLAAGGRNVKPVAFENANLFRWVGSDLHSSLGPTYDKLNREGAPGNPGNPGGAGDSQAAFVLRTALDAQVATDRIRAAVAKGSVTSFPGGALADQLRMVGSMIRAGLPTRVYYVALGGFDTHANQTFAHGRQLGEFATAVKAFYAELEAIGERSRVLTMAFSEFGRRVTQNASNGTDHGAAGPMFLFGDMINPGIVGSHPSLADLDNGDLAYGTDFRCVYASVLDQWMKIDSTKVLGKGYKPAAVISGKV